MNFSMTPLGKLSWLDRATIAVFGCGCQGVALGHYAPELSNSFSTLSTTFVPGNLLLRGADQIPSEGAGSECATEYGQHLQDPGRITNIAALMLRDCDVGKVRFQRGIDDRRWWIVFGCTVRWCCVRQ
jgi:hypothetical protein